MHFSVAVITDGTKTIEELMAPYQENNMGTCPHEFLKFFDETDDYLLSYRNNSTNMLKLHDGTFKSLKDESVGKIVDAETYDNTEWDFRIPVSCNPGKDRVYMITDLSLGEVVSRKYSDVYSTFEEFMSEEVGCEPDSETGKYGYWANPNSQWDGWVIGGRWSGIIRTKKGQYAAPGLSFFWSEPAREPGFADSCIIEDIIEEPYPEEIHEIERHWDIMTGVIKSVNKEEEQYLPESYNVKNIVEKYKTKEAYVKASTVPFITHAVVTPDGEWHSADWEPEWSERYDERFIKPYKAYRLTVVDCHV